MIDLMTGRSSADDVPPAHEARSGRERGLPQRSQLARSAGSRKGERRVGCVSRLGVAGCRSADQPDEAASALYRTLGGLVRSSQPEKHGPRGVTKFRWLLDRFLVRIFSSALVVCVILGLFVVDLGADFDDVGVLVTLLAAVIAVGIFRWTQKQTQRSNEILKRLDNRTEGFLREIQDRMAGVRPEDVGGADEEDDAAAATLPAELEEASLRTVAVSGEPHVVHRLTDVPMRVIGDLVDYWKESGLQGRWTLGRLEYALRRPGRGNHPWLLQFRDEDHLWKISYGGRSKLDATIEHLPLAAGRSHHR